MSAKKEKELRGLIQEGKTLLTGCRALDRRMDVMTKIIDRAAWQSNACAEYIDRTQELLIKTVERVECLEEWRKDHIEQDMLRRNREKREAELRVQLEMDRKKHVRRIRKAFGVASGICFLLLLGITGGLECGTIPFWLSVPLMILTACGGFVFACKAGLMVWE